MTKIAKNGIVAIALASGITAGWLDTRPGWDDTGIIVGIVLLTTFVTGFLSGKHAWLPALITGGAVTAMSFFINGEIAAAASILFAFAGAYAGALVSVVLNKLRQS